MQHLSIILTVKHVFKSTKISATNTNHNVNWVANRHVITIYMHIGHTEYTSTLLNIKIQYAHDFYQSYIF